MNSEDFGNVDVVRTITGVVKHFKRTYGFITPNDTTLDDVFVHHTQIEPWREGFKELEKGQKVKFGYVEKEKNGKIGLHAVNVEILRENINEENFKMNKDISEVSTYDQRKIYKNGKGDKPWKCDRHI